MQHFMLIETHTLNAFVRLQDVKYPQALVPIEE